MKAKLAFDEINGDSNALAKRIRAERIFGTRDVDGNPSISPELDSLEVNFSGFGTDDRLNVEDIALLALIVRAVAKSGRPVVIVYPGKFHGMPSRVFYYLSRLQFHELLSKGVPGETWHSNVSFKRYLGEVVEADPSALTTHYVPLRWFARGDFTGPVDTDPMKVEPAVKQEVYDHIRELLIGRG